jgi:predicted transcriptional regulator
MAADHIHPVVPIDGFTGEKHLDYNWNELIQRLFCEEDGLQALCKQCHKGCKTKKERELRKEHKLVKEKYPLTYTSYRGMKSRCGCKSSTGYCNYGGRGISVCSGWDSFDQFLKDMGPRPSPEHSIDRIDPDGNYEPSNCRWATQTEQMRNIRNNSMLRWGNDEFCISEWADRLSMKPNTILYRIRRGWSAGEALGFEVRQRPKWSRTVSNDEIKELYEQGLNQTEIGEELGVHSSVVSKRFKEMGLKSVNKQSLRRAERVARATEMRRMGCTLKYIADTLGCSVSSASNYICG